MIGFLTFCAFLSCTHIGLASGTVPIYGFDGASAVLHTGRTLHYQVALQTCNVVSGSSLRPEFTNTFGGHAQTWQSYNDKDVAPVPFVVFFDQKMMLNIEGGLVHLSRQVEVWGNDSALVTSIIYSADFGLVLDMSERLCTLASEDKQGAVTFSASEDEPQRILTFADLLSNLRAGQYVHFMAMTFLCQGGQEHTFSNFGGYFPNYELPTPSSSEDVELRSSVQEIVHYDRTSASHVIDVINIWMYGNRTVEIIDTRGRPPYTDLVHRHVSYCHLDTGVPGASFSIFA
ncbi:uncharacterized protein LOC127845975 isoform X4 [Dreissena polymorpha]|uniref:Uncharacterized protein n=1 Tax=Dreissena polymorpha TaxID=45954 RepID=A0A9D4N5D7_DREPO|nr:uncharacterized protein LOC127845975 isoform X3 [Dreissena polymorpha]XP_052233138.1 uncharacterized protein LOC127845975 isoform X4 [Dreissena polymorpha]KAH3888173.1 hypothetical protein DPMN_012203 [Dreissena polymorpha]